MSAVMEQMPAEAVLEVLSSIDQHRWGKARARIVAKIGRYPEGLEVSYRRLAHDLGISEGWAYEVLWLMQHERVIVEVWPPAGSRAAAYALNPNLDEWRGPKRTDGRWSPFPWVVDVELVARRAFHVEPDRGTTDDLLPRAEPAAQAPVPAAEAPRTMPAAQPRRPARLPRARPAAQSAARAAGIGRGKPQRGTSKAGPSSTGRRVGSLSGSGAGGAERGSSSIPGLNELGRAVTAAARRNGHQVAFFNGAPQRTAAGLLVDHGLDQVLAALDGAPAGAGVPAIVAWLDHTLNDDGTTPIASVDETTVRQPAPVLDWCDECQANTRRNGGPCPVEHDPAPTTNPAPRAAPPTVQEIRAELGLKRETGPVTVPTGGHL